MPRQAIERCETRWALAAKFEHGWTLLGKYCWRDATKDEPVIRTFRSRRLAREAKATACYRDESTIVKVRVRIEA